MRFLILLALLFPLDPARGGQDKPVTNDLAARAKIEGGDPQELSVTIDGSVLYQGPGAKAFVDVVENPKLPGNRFVVVRVDGEERVRLWATSLGRPVAVPSTKIGTADQITLQRESDGETMKLTAIAGEEKVVIYDGAFGKHEMTPRADSLDVLVDGVVVYRIRRVRPSAPRPASYTVDDFVKRLNAFRKAAGVPEVPANAALHRGCDLHASYVAKNHPANAHFEEASKPGYTVEGAATGPASVVQQFGSRKDLREALDGLMSVIYHRQALLYTGLREVGVGWAWDAEGRGVVVMHTGTLVSGAYEPVIWPPDGAKDIPLEFALGGREAPDPIPDPKARAGYPVTVQFDSWAPIKATGKITCDGREVPAWLSTPESPARKDRSQPDLVALIPKELLQSGKTYTVEVSCERKVGPTWSRTWSFIAK